MNKIKKIINSIKRNERYRAIIFGFYIGGGLIFTIANPSFVFIYAIGLFFLTDWALDCKIPSSKKKSPWFDRHIQ